MGAFVDLTGQHFGTREVIKQMPNNKWGGVMWSECVSKEKRIMKGAAGFNRLVRRIKRQAKEREYEYSLDDFQVMLLTSSYCRYCNTEPLQESFGESTADQEAKDWSKYIYNGIDRWNNDLGYTFDNCVPCWGTCNRTKMTMSGEEFLIHIKKIYTHNYPKKPWFKRLLALFTNRE